MIYNNYNKNILIINVEKICYKNNIIEDPCCCPTTIKYNIINCVNSFSSTSCSSIYIPTYNIGDIDIECVRLENAIGSHRKLFGFFV